MANFEKLKIGALIRRAFAALAALIFLRDLLLLTDSGDVKKELDDIKAHQGVNAQRLDALKS